MGLPSVNAVRAYTPREIRDATSARSLIGRRARTLYCVAASRIAFHRGIESDHALTIMNTSAITAAIVRRRAAGCE